MNDTISAVTIYATVWSGTFRMGMVPPLSFKSLGSQSVMGNKAIYIPRQGHTRVVLNEKEVLDTLRTFFKEDLQVYKPTNKWKEDRLVFARARYIIGPHGGAM